MKKIINILRVIILLYIFVYVIFNIAIYINKNIYKEEYPTFSGYNYIKVDNDLMEPYISQNQIIIIKKQNEFEINDIVLYTDRVKYSIKKIANRYNGKFLVKSANSDDNEEISENQVIAKVVNMDKTLSKILNILLNPVFLIIMFVSASILPEMLFSN